MFQKHLIFKIYLSGLETELHCTIRFCHHQNDTAPVLYHAKLQIYCKNPNDRTQLLLQCIYPHRFFMVNCGFFGPLMPLSERPLPNYDRWA
jgi:hypothetical protein